MFWLLKPWRWGRKLQGWGSIVVPVVAGYWLYEVAFNTVGALLLAGAVLALALAWRLGMLRTRKLKASRPAPLALRPSMPVGAQMGLGRWD